MEHDMFLRYATREEVAERLSPYKIGEVVTLLTDYQTDDGKYRSGTKFKVTKVILPLTVSVPKIYPFEINNYYVDDDKAFTYRLETILETSDKELPALSCNSSYFEKGDPDPDEYSAIYKRKSVMPLKEKICWCCFSIVNIAVFLLCVQFFYEKVDTVQNLAGLFGVSLETVLLILGGFIFSGIAFIFPTFPRLIKKRKGKTCL